VIHDFERQTTDGPLLPLPASTALQLATVELALVDVEEVGTEELAEVRERWFGFLDELDELDAQEAEERLVAFVRLLDGVLRAEPFPDVDEAENGGESVET
jgi:hypothetical protein